MSMREIKFRGKRIDNDKWVYGSYLHQYFSHQHQKLIDAIAYTNGNQTFRPQVDPETVGQFTGLKTDTGKDVYEDDIISVPELISLVNDFVDVIEFENGAFHLSRATDILVCQELMDEGVSVLGNIHDNPDLDGTADD